MASDRTRRSRNSRKDGFWISQSRIFRCLESLLVVTTKERSARRLLENFGLSILSSWLVGPIGVIYLHHIGWGKDPFLLSMIISLSTVAPIQLLMNEFVASTEIRSEHTIASHDFVTIFILSFVSVVIAVTNAGYLKIELPLISLAVFTSMSIIISYRISRRFFAGVVHTGIGRASSTMIGAVPGLAMLACYVAAGALRIEILILLGGIVPALVQAAAVRIIVPEVRDQDKTQSLYGEHGPIPAWLLYGMLLILFAVGMLTAAVRAKIAEMNFQNAALILIGLNLLGTAVVMISRSLYLAKNKDYLVLSGTVTLIFGLLSFSTLFFFSLASNLLLVATLSMAVTTVLAAGRRVISNRAKVFT